MSGDQFQRDVTQGLQCCGRIEFGEREFGRWRDAIFLSPLLRYSLPDKSALDDRPVEFRSINP